MTYNIYITGIRRRTCSSCPESAPARDCSRTMNLHHVLKGQDWGLTLQNHFLDFWWMIERAQFDFFPLENGVSFSNSALNKWDLCSIFGFSKTSSSSVVALQIHWCYWSLWGSKQIIYVTRWMQRTWEIIFYFQGDYVFLLCPCAELRELDLVWWWCCICPCVICVCVCA